MRKVYGYVSMYVSQCPLLKVVTVELIYIELLKVVLRPFVPHLWSLSHPLHNTHTHTHTHNSHHQRAL